ncbi:MAG: ABC transporter ATP-binding protein [Nocardioidaceae bacterium]
MPSTPTVATADHPVLTREDEPAMVARDVYRFFHAGDEETLALRGIDLSVRPGEVVAVFGPSGSGKSTLLSCLAGLDDPDGGSVHVLGERLSRRPEAVRAMLRACHVGVVYQSNNLLPHLTVGQNVSLAQRLVGRAYRRRPDIGQLLAELGIDNRRGALPAQLSGGETARAALAVALANDPQVLLADEPTGELDHETEAGVLRLLASRAEDGAAVLIASHSTAVERNADRVIRLEDGRVVSS